MDFAIKQNIIPFYSERLTVLDRILLSMTDIHTNYFFNKYKKLHFYCYFLSLLLSPQSLYEPFAALTD